MKTNDSQKTEQGAIASDAGELFAARRRVLKGLAAVPVAVTLGNGAALANASSHQCLTNEFELPPVCVKNNEPTDHAWHWETFTQQVTVQQCGKIDKCVPYAVENIPGTYNITGFRACTTNNNGDVFIDQNGNIIPGQPAGNPLRASCAASFM